MQKIKNKIIKLISKCFQINISKININTCADDIKKWDSLGQIRLLLLIEENFKIKMKWVDNLSVAIKSKEIVSWLSDY